ncbi:MAG TPA: hypothetical protein VN667_18010 [Burkholderiales bacterium]|nr:hypothetical protein [Burkholderiales bacterium]
MNKAEINKLIELKKQIAQCPPDVRAHIRSLQEENRQLKVTVAAKDALLTKIATVVGAKHRPTLIR